MTFGPKLTSFALPGLLVAGSLALSVSLLPFLSDDSAQPGSSDGFDTVNVDNDAVPVTRASLDQTMSKNRLAALQRFNATVQRPLFSRSRRPIEPKKTADSESAAANFDLGLDLKGILYSGDSRMAVFLGRASKEELHLLEGQSHQGWTVTTIEPKAVVFSRGDAEQRLLLNYDGKALPKPTPPVANDPWMELTPLKARRKSEVNGDGDS